MDNDRLLAALLYASLKLTHYKNSVEAAKEIIAADADISNILHGLAINKKTKNQPATNLAVAEIAKKTLTTSYQTIVKKTAPAGRTLFISKVEMYCDNYDVVQWQFIVNGNAVEQEDGSKWVDIIIPTAFTMTFDGALEIQSEKTIEVKAKDDGSGANAWADITGVSR